MDRRQFLKSAASAFSATTLSIPPSRAQAAPIKVGVLAPLTGVVASGGREMVEGTQFWFDGIKNEIAGRRVQLLIEDDASNPDVALQKARRLVEQSNVHFLVGNLLANTGLAVANYVKGTGTPYFIPIIAADDLTQRQRIRNVIRVAGYSASAFTHPFGDWALKKGYKKIATISQDYSFGHEQCGGIAQVFTEGGGQIVAQLWNPLNTSDFGPYLGQIAGLNVDAVFRRAERRRRNAPAAAICGLRIEGADSVHGPCKRISVIATFSTRSGTPSYCRTGSRISGGSRHGNQRART
jgi:branched-chain amino acid transport system substrate-binding protein